MNFITETSYSRIIGTHNLTKTSIFEETIHVSLDKVTGAVFAYEHLTR